MYNYLLYYKDPPNIMLNYTSYVTVIKLRLNISRSWRTVDAYFRFFLKFSFADEKLRDERTRTLTQRHARNFSDRFSRGNSTLRRATGTEIYSGHVSNGRRSTDSLGVGKGVLLFRSKRILVLETPVLLVFLYNPQKSQCFITPHLTTAIFSSAATTRCVG